MEKNHHFSISCLTDMEWFDMLLTDDQVPVYDDGFEEINEEWFDDLLNEETQKTMVQQEHTNSEFQFSITIFSLQNDRKNRKSVFQEARNMGKRGKQGHSDVNGGSYVDNNMLLEEWFYIFILYDIQWLKLYLMGFQPWHVFLGGGKFGVFLMLKCQGKIVSVFSTMLLLPPLGKTMG